MTLPPPNLFKSSLLQRLRNRTAWLVGALAVAQLVSWGSMYYGFSLFILPMERELGWSRTAMHGALSVGLLVSGLCAYPVGRRIDLHGGRLVMTAGSVAAAGLFMVWSLAASLPLLFLVWVGLGAVMSATLYDPVFAVLTQRFPQSFRQKIIAVTLVAGFASTVFIPLTQALVSHLGWRTALQLLGMANLLVCAPIHWFCLRPPRTGLALAPGATSVRLDARETVTVPHQPELFAASATVTPMARALVHPSFWGLVICFTCYNAAFAAMTFHLVPLLSERRVSTATIVTVLALVGPAQVLARMLLLSLGPRLHAGSAGQVTVAGFALSILLLFLFPTSIPILIVAMLIYGGANGMLTIVRGTAVPDLLGQEGYGAINGAISFPANMARALGPLGAALVWSASGNYETMLLWVLGVSVLSMVAFRYAVVHALTGRHVIRAPHAGSP